jgi:hypothetical protein
MPAWHTPTRSRPARCARRRRLRPAGRSSSTWTLAARSAWIRSSSGPNILKRATDRPPGLEPTAAETLEKAVELIGYGKELPDDEAIGVAVGWWPSFGIASGAYVKINGDGSGTIITGAQECGTGAVMALPLLAAEILGMKPDDFQLLYQDTDAGPFDSGASGSQTTFNNGRAVMQAARDVREQLLDLAAEELEANRDDLELVDGVAASRDAVQERPDPDLAEKAYGDGCCSAAARTPCPRCPTAMPRAAPAGWAWSRSSHPPSSPTPSTARSIERPASCGCWTWRRCTSRAAC